MKSPDIQTAVLVYVVKNNKLLLSRKARKVNAGKLTSFGGKFENNESEIECVQRELKQESGLNVEASALRKAAIIDFHNTDTDVWRVHTYIANKFSGTPKSTDEMTNPKWYDISKLPFDDMPWSDHFWLPLLLAGKKLKVVVYKEPLSISIKNLE